MSDRNELWQKILDTLDDTLQYGFLEETRFVSKVTVEDGKLRLIVPPRSAEAERAHEFLSQPENKNRILILAKRLFKPAAGEKQIEQILVLQE